MSLTIACWNINSVRFRLTLIQQVINKLNPDILCLQEIKCTTEQFPYEFFQNLGYKYNVIRGQKSYHGVATLSRYPIKESYTHIFCEQNDCRHLATRLESREFSLWIHNLYVPAGGDLPCTITNPKFAHKLQFLEEMKQFKSIDSQKNYNIILGDFNVAPLPQDVWNHKALLKIVSHTPVETNLLTDIYQTGKWYDLIRHKLGENNPLFTWWSYRSPNWKKANKGRRLDHIWGPKELIPYIANCQLWKEFRDYEKPSDHIPLEIKLKINILEKNF